MTLCSAFAATVRHRIRAPRNIVRVCGEIRSGFWRMLQLEIEFEVLLNDGDGYLNGVFSKQSRWKQRSLARFIGISRHWVPEE